MQAAAKAQLDGSIGGMGNNKSTHVLLNKNGERTLPIANVHDIEASYINYTNNEPKIQQRADGFANPQVVTSAPRVVALAHNSVEANNVDRANKDSTIHHNAHLPNSKTLNPEYYKSLQVARSNTTTGYMPGSKTSVQLSQNLQPTNNTQLTSNGMSIVANAVGPRTGVIKVEPSSRLNRDQDNH